MSEREEDPRLADPDPSSNGEQTAGDDDLVQAVAEFVDDLVEADSDTEPETL